MILYLTIKRGKNELMEEEGTQKHQSKFHLSNQRDLKSHPLDNLVIPLDSGMHTQYKTRNMIAFSAFLSQIEPKISKNP